MNYPLISDYVSSILSAEDNFKELTNLRPVLDEEGQPTMSSGNFAVVFKMKDEQTGKEIRRSKLRIFNTCINLIRTLPVVQRDEKNPNDVAKNPHELTHAPDAIRGFCIERTKATRIMTEEELRYEESRKQRRRLGILGIAGATATKDYMKYGG